MTDPTARETHDLVFEILGNFARVQSLIDDMLIRMFMRSRIPELGEVLYDFAIDKRIRDDDRRRSVIAIIKDTKQTENVDFQVFSSTFADVKRVRDLIAHSVSIDPQTDGSIVVQSLGPKKLPNDGIISRAELEKSALHCSWLAAVVGYLFFGLYEQPFRTGDNKFSVLRAPCRLPRDWHGGTGVQSTEFDLSDLT